MESTLNNLRSLLASPDEEVRRSAVASLKDFPGEGSLKLLDQALGDESWRVRKAAVESLRAYPDRTRAARVLVLALSDSDNAGRRSSAVEALVSMGGQALPSLHDSIRHTDEDVRKFIVDILGEIRDQSSLDFILPLVSDGSENIRLAAVEALGSIGGQRAFQPLITLLHGNDISLQFSVLHALGRIGKPIPMDAIRPLLGRKILRRATFDALGQTKSPEAVDFLIKGLSDPTKSARQSALRALHSLASDPALANFVKQKVKKAATKPKLSGLAEFLSGDHLPTKRASVALLSMIGTPEAARILIEAAQDDSVRVEIADALAQLKSSSPDVVDQVVKDEEQSQEEVVQVLREAPPLGGPLGPMPDERFQSLRDLVSKRSGLYYDRELKYLFERRVQRRMEAVSLGDYDRYLKLVTSAGAAGTRELTALIGALSTNETYFFREDFQLRAFKLEVLPELKKLKQGSGARVRIWSAGCSSGEEPYTLAILIRESSGLEDLEFEITGSDISERMLEQARAGLYNRSSFRSTDEVYIKKYFRPEQSRYRLSDEIKQMVSFDNTNIMNCGKAGRLQGLDVIFCRNVIIYFSPEAKQSVVDQFYDLLAPGGYLMLGHSESLMSVSSKFELKHLKNDLVYRKPEGGHSP